MQTSAWNYFYWWQSPFCFTHTNVIIFFFIILLQSCKGKLKLFPHNIFSEHWQFIKDYRMVKAQLPAEDCIRDIQNGRVYQKFIQHDPCARGKKALLIVVSTDGAGHPWLSPRSLRSHLFVFLWSYLPKKHTNLKTSYLLDCGMGSLNHMCHHFWNIYRWIIQYGKW